MDGEWTTVAALVSESFWRIIACAAARFSTDRWRWQQRTGS
jgi:hypothetical protein